MNMMIILKTNILVVQDSVHHNNNFLFEIRALPPGDALFFLTIVFAFRDSLF